MNHFIGVNVTGRKNKFGVSRPPLNHSPIIGPFASCRAQTLTQWGRGEVGREYKVVYWFERWCFFGRASPFRSIDPPVASSSKTHLIKESIRLAFSDLGAFHYERGDLNASLKTRHRGPFNRPFGKPKWRWKDVHLHPSMGKFFSSLPLLSAVLFLRQSTTQSNIFFSLSVLSLWHSLRFVD